MLMKNMCVAALSLATILGGATAAKAGGDCCGSAKKGTDGNVADAPAAKPVEKKKEACGLGECDTKVAAKTEAVLAKLNAPADKLTADDEKALADAKRTLVTT